MENWLVQLFRQEVIISEAKQLIQYPRRRKANASFLGDNFQML
jgi:hypothetical protein